MIHTYPDCYTTKCYQVLFTPEFFYIGSHFGKMEGYETSSDRLKKMMKDYDVKIEDLVVRILMESIYEKEVRSFERYLNCNVYRNNRFCLSRRSETHNSNSLEKLYIQKCHSLGIQPVFEPTVQIMLDVIDSAEEVPITIDRPKDKIIRVIKQKLEFGKKRNMNNGIQNLQVLLEDVDDFLKKGWVFGFLKAHQLEENRRTQLPLRSARS